MRLIIQRVNSASVIIDNTQYSSIKKGLLCFVAFCDGDTKQDFKWSVNKILNLKLFPKKKSLNSICGEVLVVSQFTLFARIKKGTQPSWSRAAKPNTAKIMYDDFIGICRQELKNRIQTGLFGTNMHIKSVNDGPITLIIDTKQKE